MKLPEAMVEGCKETKPTFGSWETDGRTKACAVGAAGVGQGLEFIDITYLCRTWPELDKQVTPEFLVKWQKEFEELEWRTLMGDFVQEPELVDLIVTTSDELVKEWLALEAEGRAGEDPRLRIAAALEKLGF